MNPLLVEQLLFFLEAVPLALFASFRRSEASVVMTLSALSTLHFLSAV